MSQAHGTRPLGLAVFRGGNGELIRPHRWPARVRAVGLIALGMALAGCASASAREIAGAADESTPPSLDTRLKALSEKYAVEERQIRDPARIRAQIASLEARRLKLLERYLPTHPGVLQIERQLQTLKVQLAESEAAQATTAPPAP